MKKYLAFSTIAILLSTLSFAQTTQEQIDKAMKDPKAAENAAKADARLIDKKNIKDSTGYKEGVSGKAAKKERSCLFKRKKRS